MSEKRLTNRELLKIIKFWVWLQFHYYKFWLFCGKKVADQKREQIIDFFSQRGRIAKRKAEGAWVPEQQKGRDPA